MSQLRWSAVLVVYCWHRRTPGCRLVPVGESKGKPLQGMGRETTPPERQRISWRVRSPSLPSHPTVPRGSCGRREFPRAGGLRGSGGGPASLVQKPSEMQPGDGHRGDDRPGQRWELRRLCRTLLFLRGHGGFPCSSISQHGGRRAGREQRNYCLKFLAYFIDMCWQL